MSTGPKAAAFAVLLRVMFEINAPGRFWLIWVSAALSMTLGNIGALVQDNIKRLLAYSSIAHAGYVLVAFAAQPELGTSAVMFYTAAYAAMNVGAFAVVSHFANAGEKYLTLEDYAGLGRRSPMLAATLTFFLMSLIGIPITGGFFGKFYIFSAALKSNLVGLTIIGLINSAVAAYYYLRVIVMMYMRQPRGEVPVTATPPATGLAIALCVLATLLLGVVPGRVLDYATQSAQNLVSRDTRVAASSLRSSSPGDALHSTATDRSRCEKIHAATSQNTAVSVHPSKTMPGLACHRRLKSALINGSSNPWTGITYFENASPRSASSAGMPANVPAPIAAKSGGMNVESSSVSDAVSMQAVHSASIPNHIAPSLNPKCPRSQLAVNPMHKQNTPRTSAIPASNPNMYWRREIPFDSTASMRRDRWSA
jgi:hypothetical protein